MTEKLAFSLLIAGAAISTVVGVLGLYALGVRGILLSFGFIVPMVVTGYGIGSVVMHYSEVDRRRR